MTLGVQGMTRNYLATEKDRRNLGLKGRLRALLAMLPLMLWTAGAWAQDSGLSLEAVDVSAQAGERVVIYLRMSGAAPEPLSFAIDNPARISLDLPNTSMALASRRTVVKEGPLDTVVAAEAQGRTRVVLNMDYMVPYETHLPSAGMTCGQALRPCLAWTMPFDPRSRHSRNHSRPSLPAQYKSAFPSRMQGAGGLPD